MDGDLLIQPLFVVVSNGNGNFYKFAVVFRKVRIESCMSGRASEIFFVVTPDALDYVSERV